MRGREAIADPAQDRPASQTALLDPIETMGVTHAEEPAGIGRLAFAVEGDSRAGAISDTHYYYG